MPPSSSPNTRTDPAERRINPKTALSSIVFPDPFGPNKPYILPSGKETLISERIVRPLITFAALLTSTHIGVLDMESSPFVHGIGVP